MIRTDPENLTPVPQLGKFLPWENAPPRSLVGGFLFSEENPQFGIHVGCAVGVCSRGGSRGCGTGLCGFVGTGLQIWLLGCEDV